MNIGKKKDYCVRRAFENLRNTKYQPSLKETLNRIEEQAKQNRQKRENQEKEYAKTVKLLNLLSRNK